MIQIGATGWFLVATGLAFLAAVFACWVFSLQLCMAYFGEEIPSYWGCVGVKLKMIAAIAATVLVCYAFLGPLCFLAAPASFVVVLLMISNAAHCDRFFAAIITLSHSAICSAATAFCMLVFWLGLSSLGYDADAVAGELRSLSEHPSESRSFTFENEEHPEHRRRNVAHTNPFVGSTDGEAER
ncbi:hypothetical protein CKO51_03900 [Rhodopirellula sp. SM50]|nr:hypothetical protein CKO51_03900 [Rhodopirellula sp. SM50]